MIDKLWGQLGNLVDSSTMTRKIMARKESDQLDVFVGTMSKNGTWVDILERKYPYNESGLKDAIMDMTNVLEG